MIRLGSVRGKAIGGALALLLAAPAAADNWLFTGTSDDGADYFVDLGSIRPAAGGDRAIRLAWIRSDHFSDETARAAQSMMLYRFDCARRTFQLAQWVDYDFGGNILAADRRDGEIATVPQGSIIDNIRQLVCAGPL
ncbi:MAG: surface-adhesin E family protein [Erythrobacter sp.]